MNKSFYGPTEVAQKLEVARITLHRWGKAGKGPVFYKTPTGRARYPKKEFHEWVAQHWPELEITA